ncbi:hypothetical protein GCM10009733_088360 [Nonomuraea maheshkhaliensis]|uniref:Uncharacterized protein n=1 Tax=Nonomuraea maheshkhaliensis TaxID=419590 RepID=A0ABN2GXG8_9ACTN
MTVTPRSDSSTWNVGTEPSARGAGVTVTVLCSPSTARTCTWSPVINVISSLAGAGVKAPGGAAVAFTADAADAAGIASDEAAMSTEAAITVPRLTRLKPRSMDDLPRIGKHEYRIPSHPELRCL